MKPADNTIRRGGFSALVQSYAADLRGWATRIATGYAVAIVLLVAGLIAVFAAAGVGLSAVFYWVQVHYGTKIAYAVIGGGLLVLGAILILIGVAVLRRKVPPLPRPHRQAQAAKQLAAGSIAVRAVSMDATKADAMTQVLIGAAATALAGWLVATRMQGRRRR